MPDWSALGSSVLMLDDNPREVRSEREVSVTERRTRRTRFSDGTRSPMASGVQSCSTASSPVT